MQGSSLHAQALRKCSASRGWGPLSSPLWTALKHEDPPHPKEAEAP